MTGASPQARRRTRADSAIARESAASDPLPALLAERERFLAFLGRRVGDAATAEDLLHGAFTKVIERSSAPRNAKRVVPWFFRVLRRMLVDRARRNAAGKRALEKRSRGRAVATSELEDQVCACVGALVRTLPPEHQDILQRVEIDGDSVREAADRLGITPSAAAVRAHRARAALRRRIQEMCGACSEHRCLRCECGGRAEKTRPGL
jgi:RNA polymerase sigma-70 factor (ECF subfamily)